MQAEVREPGGRAEKPLHGRKKLRERGLTVRGRESIKATFALLVYNCGRRGTHGNPRSGASAGQQVFSLGSMQ